MMCWDCNNFNFKETNSQTKGRKLKPKADIKSI